jgi:hypothetical protein
MIWLMCSEVLVGLALLAVLVRTRNPGRLFVSEESAHAAALGRQSRGPRGRSMGATVLALGDEESRSPCRVVKVSRSKLHLVSSRPVRAGVQLRVQRGEECFVGTVRQVAVREDGYFLNMGVLASNYRPPRATGWLPRAAARGLVSLLQRFAVRVLGAELRPRQS